MEAVYMNHTEPDDIYAAVVNTVRENVDYIWGKECETLKDFLKCTNHTEPVIASFPQGYEGIDDFHTIDPDQIFVHGQIKQPRLHVVGAYDVIFSVPMHLADTLTVIRGQEEIPTPISEIIRTQRNWNKGIANSYHVKFEAKQYTGYSHDEKVNIHFAKMEPLRVIGIFPEYFLVVNSLTSYGSMIDRCMLIPCYIPINVTIATGIVGMNDDEYKRRLQHYLKHVDVQQIKKLRPTDEIIVLPRRTSGEDYDYLHFENNTEPEATPCTTALFTSTVQCDEPPALPPCDTHRKAKKNKNNDKSNKSATWFESCEATPSTPDVSRASTLSSGTSYTSTRSSIKSTDMTSLEVLRQNNFITELKTSDNENNDCPEHDARHANIKPRTSPSTYSVPDCHSNHEMEDSIHNSATSSSKMYTLSSKSSTMSSKTSTISSKWSTLSSEASFKSVSSQSSATTHSTVCHNHDIAKDMDTSNDDSSKLPKQDDNRDECLDNDVFLDDRTSTASMLYVEPMPVDCRDRHTYANMNYCTEHVNNELGDTYCCMDAGASQQVYTKVCESSDLLQRMATKDLVAVYPDHLVEIHSHSRDDVLEFLAPLTIRGKKDVDARCKLLSDLRDKLRVILCFTFPDFRRLELNDRHLPQAFVSDVYAIGNSIRCHTIDAGLRAVFKPASVPDSTAIDDAQNMIVISPKDVVNTRLLRRDSVASLKHAIICLQHQVKDLQTEVRQIRSNAFSINTFTANVDVHEHSKEGKSLEQDLQGKENDIREKTKERYPAKLSRDRTNTTDVHQPSNHPLKLQTDGMNTKDSDIDTSECIYSFRGAEMCMTPKLRSIYIGNTFQDTSLNDIREHLVSIGLGDDIVNIHSLPSRYKHSKHSFCVTLKSEDAEAIAYNSQWPDQVVVRPYHAPRQKYHQSGNAKNNRYQNNNYHRAGVLQNQWHSNVIDNQLHNRAFIQQPQHLQSPMQAHYVPFPQHQLSSLQWYNGHVMP